MRVDSGVREGDSISVHYDPLIAKLIVSAESRDDRIGAPRAGTRASFPILGITTNIPFLVRLAQHPDVGAGRIDTGFVEREIASLAGDGAADLPDVVAAIAAAQACAPTPIQQSASNAALSVDPWML